MGHAAADDLERASQVDGALLQYQFVYEHDWNVSSPIYNLKGDKHKWSSTAVAANGHRHHYNGGQTNLHPNGDGSYAHHRCHCDEGSGHLHRKGNDDYCSAMTATAELLHLFCYSRYYLESYVKATMHRHTDKG